MHSNDGFFYNLGKGLVAQFCRFVIVGAGALLPATLIWIGWGKLAPSLRLYPLEWGQVYMGMVAVWAAADFGFAVWRMSSTASHVTQTVRQESRP